MHPIRDSPVWTIKKSCMDAWCPATSPSGVITMHVDRFDTRGVTRGHKKKHNGSTHISSSCTLPSTASSDANTTTAGLHDFSAACLKRARDARRRLPAPPSPQCAKSGETSINRGRLLHTSWGRRAAKARRLGGAGVLRTERFGFLGSAGGGRGTCCRVFRRSLCSSR